MKKPFIYILTAGLAVSMIANTSTANAEQIAKEGSSDATISFTDSGLFLEEISDIEFGLEEAIKSSNDTIDSDKISATVSDLRGTGDGWELKAKISEFNIKGEPATSSLEGAMITFNEGNADSPDKINQAVALTAPVFQESIEFENTESHKLVTASATTTEQKYYQTEGLGTWNMSWTPSISIPGAVASSDDHEAQITWTLYNTPDTTGL